MRGSYPQRKQGVEGQAVNASPYRRFVHHAVTACVAVALVAGCRAKEPITSWHSPRLLKTQKEWQSLQDAVRGVSGTREYKEKYGLKNEKLDAMLDAIIAQISEADARRLAASCEQIPVRSKDRSAFTNAVLAHIVSVLVASGDRDRLVTLLSTRFVPRLGGYATIEWYLAFFGRKLKDPIMILGEAYSKCQAPAVRHDIASAVRRGFTDLGVRGKDDAEFVRNAMQWYGKEKDGLVPNVRYLSNDQSFPLELYDKYPEQYTTHASERQLLFEKKGIKGAGDHH